MKKLVLIIFFIVVFFTSNYIYGKDENQIRYVNSENGLRLRLDGNNSGKILDTIPFGSKVEIIEEKDKEEVINNTKGKWCKVKWQNKSGWVFNAYLSENIIKKTINLSGTYLSDYKYEKPKLIFDSSGKFSMTINHCQGMLTIRGEYKIINNRVVLDFQPKQYVGFDGEDDKMYELEIISDKSLKFLNSVGCAPEKDSIFTKH
jgi:hypothetical protein